MENERGSQGGIANGGAEGSRTPDLLIANETLYQLSYDPIHQITGEFRLVLRSPVRTSIDTRRNGIYYAVLPGKGKPIWRTFEASTEAPLRVIRSETRGSKTSP